MIVCKKNEEAGEWGFEEAKTGGYETFLEARNAALNEIEKQQHQILMSNKQFLTQRDGQAYDDLERDYWEIFDMEATIAPEDESHPRPSA